MDTYEKKYNEALLRADEAVQKGCLDKNIFDIIFPPEESEKPLTPFQQCLNVILHKVYFASVPKTEDVDKFILDIVKSYTDELVELAKKHEYCQLRESEDERIRKYLIEEIKAAKSVGELKFIIPQPTREECIAYLEKQKVNTDGDFARGYDCGYECCLNSHGAEWFEKQEEIPMPSSTELIDMWDAEKAILKEKDIRGDEWRLAYNAFMDGFARGTCVKFEKQKEQVMDETDKIAAAYQLGRSDERKQKEQKLVDYTEELKKCKENPLYFCDKYVKIKQKPAEWSKEDEETWKDVIAILEQFGRGLAMTTREKRDKMVSWLKSLRPSWKPSEEHLSALLAVFNDPNNIGSQTCQLALSDLYEQLLKLK